MIICDTYLGRPNGTTSTFVCDSAEDINNLPTTTKKGTGDFDFNHYANIGSTCTVGNEGGDIMIYMLFSFGWKQIS